MKKILSILLISVILFSCSESEIRYHIDQTTSPTDTLTFLKLDMTTLNGIVFCEFGENGKYINGKKDGIHKEWYEDGQIESEENLKLGGRNFDNYYLKKWWENGQLHVNHNKKGYINYFDNGHIMKEGKLKNWKEIGIHKSYYSNGSLMIEINKENDSMIIFDKSGKSLYNGGYDFYVYNTFFYDQMFE
jgi:hypothetical protein